MHPPNGHYPRCTKGIGNWGPLIFGVDRRCEGSITQSGRLGHFAAHMQQGFMMQSRDSLSAKPGDHCGSIKNFLARLVEGGKRCCSRCRVSNETNAAGLDLSQPLKYLNLLGIITIQDFMF